MGTITRSFANLITASGPSAVADGTIVNADINASAAIDASKLTGISSQPFRNIVINGDMQISQRSTSVSSITTTDYYTLDRFRIALGTLGTFTMSQSTDVPTGQGFSKSLKLDCTTADASPSAGDLMILQHIVEGQNLQYLKKGTADAVSLTASFWVKSTKTGTFILELNDTDNTRAISKSYTVNVSNTWEYKTLTFEGDTTGAFDNDNGGSLEINFWLGVGTNFSSGTLATTWGGRVSANQAVGQVNIADSTANDFLITGVQLEAGTSATDFEFLPIDVNLGRCQRYYYLHVIGNGQRVATGSAYSGSMIDATIQFPVSMRADPSLVIGSGTNYFRCYGNATSDDVNTFTILETTVNLTGFRNDGQFSGTQGYSYFININNASAFVAFSAEL